MTTIRTHATNLILAAATVVAIGAALLMPGQASAAIPGHNPGDPWPEPPSCSNETLSCDPIEDWLAYECFFENSNSPFSFCENPMLEMQGGRGPTLVTPQPDPDPAPLKLVAPAGRR